MVYFLCINVQNYAYPYIHDNINFNAFRIILLI